MKLVGLGKRRFATLQQGIKDQLVLAPMDGRFLPRGYRPQSEKAQIVHSFLMDLYLKAGEFLPDSGNSSSNKRPRQGQYKLDEKQLDRSKIRHLPPGRIADYHRLIQAENPDAKISKKLFSTVAWVNSISDVHFFFSSIYMSSSFSPCFIPSSHSGSITQVWMKGFSGLLRIRSEGHHSRCAICVRHRLIIRRVGRGPARRQQILLFKRHLCRQYRDRQVYWSHRCKSRDDAVTGAPATFISCIIDSMDQQKHSCPRSEAMASKEFNSWNRPRLQSTTLIVHGHCVITGLSPPNTPGGGSRTMELIAYAMTKPLKYVQWSNVFLCLEADNCSKELKHQTSLRMLASMIAQCQLRGCEYNYLQSGHSHEDVDAFFFHCIGTYRTTSRNMGH